MLAATGVYLELGDDLVRPLLGRVARLTPSPFDPPASSTALAAEAFDRGAARTAIVDQARRIAAERAMDAPFDIFHHRESGIWGVGLGDHHAPGLGVPWLYFDSSGTLVQTETPDSATPADRALAAMFPLHTGNAFGLPGRVLIAVTGVAVAVLSVTGVLIWARRYRSRAARSRLPVGLEPVRPAAPERLRVPACNRSWSSPTAAGSVRVRDASPGGDS
jgi:uncharacterized iron-regulated membrane protein